jgi:hypothetical protein
VQRSQQDWYRQLHPERVESRRLRTKPFAGTVEFGDKSCPRLFQSRR